MRIYALVFRVLRKRDSISRNVFMEVRKSNMTHKGVVTEGSSARSNVKTYPGSIQTSLNQTLMFPQ